MEKFVRWNLTAGTVIGLLGLWFTPVIGAQVSPQQQRSTQQMNISDKELMAFVKAYVEIQKIRLAYESSLRNVEDPKERGRIQQEGNSKIEKVLAKQGLNQETYNRTFTVVNTNDEIRTKALKLIQEERKKS